MRHQNIGAAEAVTHHIFPALQDPSSRDYGTGIATVKKDKNGKLGFRKYYYEPEFKGGNYGTEDCVRRTQE